MNVPALIAGMVAGADCIDDMDLLRQGALPRLLPGGRAPSTLGTFLWTFTFGHVRQLDAVARRLLINLACWAPLLPGGATTGTLRAWLATVPARLARSARRLVLHLPQHC